MKKIAAIVLSFAIPVCAPLLGKASPSQTALNSSARQAPKPAFPGAWTAWSPLKDGYRNSVDVRWRHEGDYLFFSLHNRYAYEVVLDVEAEVADATGKKSQHSESYALKAGALEESKERRAIGIKVISVRIKKMTATHPQWGELEVVPRNQLGERADAEAKILAAAEKKKADDLALKKAEAERLAAATKKAAVDAAIARPAAQKAMQEAQAANDAALQKALAWEDDPKRPRVYPKVVLGDRSAVVNEYMAKFKEDTSVYGTAEKLNAMAADEDKALNEYKQVMADAQSSYDTAVSYLNAANHQPDTQAGRFSASIANIAAQSAIDKQKSLEARAQRIEDDILASRVERKRLAAEGQQLERIYQAGSALRKEGKYLDAEYAFRQLVSQRPDDAYSHFCLALILYEQKRLLEADAEWRTTLRLDKPENLSNDLRNLGTNLLEQNRFGEAEVTYRSALTANQDANDRADLLFDLAQALWKQNKLTDAELEARKALVLAPGAATHQLIGYILAQGQKWSEAEAEYRAASQLQPNDYSILALWGDMLMKQEKWADAATAYAAAVKIAPQWLDYRRKLGDALLKQEKWAEAEAQYREGIKLNSNNAFCHFGLGEALFKQSKLAEATPEFNEAIRLKSKQLFVLGSVYFDLKRFAVAESLYRSATALEPDDALKRYWLAQALDKQLRTDEAIVEYREAARLDPKDGIYPDILGTSLYNAEKYSDAEAAFREAIKAKPDNGVFYANLASVPLHWDTRIRGFIKNLVLHLDC